MTPGDGGPMESRVGSSSQSGRGVSVVRFAVRFCCVDASPRTTRVEPGRTGFKRTPNIICHKTHAKTMTCHSPCPRSFSIRVVFTMIDASISLGYARSTDVFLHVIHQTTRDPSDVGITSRFG